MLHQVMTGVDPQAALRPNGSPPWRAARAPTGKPDRLNLARVCLWCGVRDCDSARCIELHARSRWMVCDECDGYSSGGCFCVQGVVEAAPDAAPAIA
jgi:hypothetical protein